MRRALALLAATLAALTAPAGTAVALEPSATWRLEQPPPPPAPPGAAESSLPAGLGSVGDVEFWAPNRGLLVTAGNPPTVPAGVWAYDGVRWHELATVCGGVEAPGGEPEGGRIAWAGPDEFWTIAGGRPGQAGQSGEFFEPPPLTDNTLCHFASGQVVGSYAHAEFQADSYQRMQAGACFAPSDCWFAGDPLPEPQVGAFQLHWDGASLQADPYPGEGHAVEDMRVLEGRLFESVRISARDRVSNEEVRQPPALHRINPEGVQPTFLGEGKLPLYGEEELPEALDSLDLSAAEGVLWAAAGPKQVEAGAPGQVTVIRRAKGAWRQLIGPGDSASETPAKPLGAVLPAGEEKQLLGGEASRAAVVAIAAEPGSGDAWLALRPREGALDQLRAVLLRVSAEGKVLEERTLPSAAEGQEGVGPKGAAARLACPAVEDCWLVTTQGWLFHMAPEGRRALPRDEAPSFAGLITYRPPDQGLPQIPPDAPPPDTSGLPEEQPELEVIQEKKSEETEARVTLPLLSRIHTRLVHGTTLQLSFHLAVRARVRLIAKRHSTLVAQTPMRTLKAGNRSLLLRLNPRRWPTKLSLQTHALAPLPTVSSHSPNVGSISTGFFVLPHESLLDAAGSLP